MKENWHRLIELQIVVSSNISSIHLFIISSILPSHFEFGLITRIPHKADTPLNALNIYDSKMCIFMGFFNERNVTMVDPVFMHDIDQSEEVRLTLLCMRKIKVHLTNEPTHSNTKDYR